MASRKKKVASEGQELESLRGQIDAVDQQLQALINQRAALARQVGHSKQMDGAPADFYRPEREAEVLRMAKARNRDGLLSDEEILRVFREIMSACLAQESQVKVAYLGPEGTFSQSAVLKHFGHSVQTQSLKSIDEVFLAVQGGRADFGVVPVENSSEGAVSSTLDRFMTTKLHICGEVELQIHHNLMGRMQELSKVRRVCAHPQALGQCSTWLEEHLPGIERVPVNSNAEGARRARDEEGTAGIAGLVAAQIYDLDILVSNIEDADDNTTRFLVVGNKQLRPTGNDKTTILVSGAESTESGMLFRLLEPLARNKISMSRIESRPSRRRKWDYVFFIELEGHADDKPVARALTELKKRASLFRVLGSYPRAVL
jgi:chorismate mutase / prephenate dehydratase